MTVIEAAATRMRAGRTARQSKRRADGRPARRSTIRRPQRRRQTSMRRGVSLVGDPDPGRQPARHRGPGRRAAAGGALRPHASSPASPWRGSGTRSCSTPSGATSRGRPSTRATSTTCRPACGTPGPPTTRSPTASSSTRSSSVDDPAAARDRAISYAAYRILSHRYGEAVGAEESLAEFDALMDSALLPDGPTPGPAATRPRRSATASPRASSARACATAHGSARTTPRPTTRRSTSRSSWRCRARRWTTPTAGSRWRSRYSYAQNGVPLPVGPQQFVGPHWGHVKTFALPESEAGLPIDPGAAAAAP